MHARLALFADGEPARRYARLLTVLGPCRPAAVSAVGAHIAHPRAARSYLRYATGITVAESKLALLASRGFVARQRLTPTAPPVDFGARQARPIKYSAAGKSLMAITDEYEMLRGSEVSRGGMYLELWHRPSGNLALWAFYRNADRSFEFTRYRTDVPADVETWFQQEARRLLPPNTAQRGT